MCILVLAAGGTGITASVVTPDGRIAARSHRELATHVPGPGLEERAPEEIWQAALGATRACLAQWAGETTDLSGIGITNERDTVLLWDRETLGAPRRAITGNDRRSLDLCQRLRVDGRAQRVTELTGLPPDPRGAAVRLRWLAEHEPNTWALVEQGRYAIGTVDSYLVARMTRGTWHVTDVSNAGSTLLFDLEADAWSEELCEVFGVPLDALPEVVPSWGALARTEPRSFLGLDLPISGIAGDRHAALFGQACFEVGDTCLSSDGSLSLTSTGTHVVRSGAGLVPAPAWRSPDGRTTYVLEGSIPAGSRGTTDARPDRPARETIAFAVRDVVLSLPTVPTSLRVDGQVDDVLCQLQADVLGVPVLRSEALETATLGAAFMAGLGTGSWSSTADLRHRWHLDREFVPG